MSSKKGLVNEYIPLRVKHLNTLWKAKKKYARYALLQKTKGYISYETIFSLSSTLISNNAASLAKGQILGLG